MGKVGVIGPDLAEHLFPVHVREKGVRFAPLHRISRDVG